MTEVVVVGLALFGFAMLIVFARYLAALVLVEPTRTSSRDTTDRTTGAARQGHDGEVDSGTPSYIATSAATDQADPMDTPYYLHQRGWELVTHLPERYVGRYQANGEEVLGVLERTSGGRRKFYVNFPTKELRRSAHHGLCLTRPKNKQLAELDRTYKVHFDPEPDSFGDGIDAIEALMHS